MGCSLLSWKKNCGFFLALGILAVTLQAGAFSRQVSQESGTQAGDPWGPDRLIQPEELSRILPRLTTGKPLLLHIGIPYLYRNAHIGGSRFAGPANTPEGIEKLKDEVQKLPTDTEIILYCGCCPWNVCPNTRPAFRTLSELGFKNVRVLYLLHNLQQDWIQKGFPIEKRAGVADQ